MGGTGKTPFTAYLASNLKSLGYSPAILTRGYRRQSRGELLLSFGAQASPVVTGDEAQILLQTGASPIGIGADRYSVAQRLLAAYPETDVLLLDDGFQHARMQRNVDIVLLDALDPFSNGEVLPLGRLREPVESLRRADIVVITRCDSEDRYEAIANRVRSIKQGMSVFRTATCPGLWRSAKTGEQVDLSPSSVVAAFCGLGNPHSFWQTLEQLSLKPVMKKAFRDHHRYRASEIRSLAQAARKHGAEVMLTTEKDVYNLTEETLAATELELLYLPIKLAVTEETEFFNRLRACF